MDSTHHRLPIKLGGSNNGSNLVKVNEKRHDRWHRLFGTLNPFQIAKVMNDEFLADTRFKVKVHTERSFRGGQKGCKDKDKRRDDWRKFKGSKDIYSLCNEMNSVWLPRKVVFIPIKLGR